MPALIEQLIDKRDGSEVVRDQIAAILTVESASQQALAAAAEKDPALWRLRVFLERSNPWQEFIAASEGEVDRAPIVHVGYDSSTFPRGQGNVVAEQRATGTFHIDTYGYGVSSDLVGGHVPGDLKAALEAQRAMRLVRNILMSAHYTYLGLRGLVARRWPSSITMFQPAADASNVQHVVASRLTLEVDFAERSPQVTGTPYDGVLVEVTRSDSGQLLMSGLYQTTP